MFDRMLAMCALAGMLGACSTQAQLLEMRRDQLLRLEQAARATAAQAANGEFRPGDYDLYLHLDRKLFEQTLGGFSGMTAKVEASGRSIEIRLPKIAMAFRPGAAELSIDMAARDLRSGVEAEIYTDVRLVIEGDPEKPDALYLRLVPTRLVPRLAWGPLDSSKKKFVRDLVSVGALRLAARLPRLALPLQKDFEIGDDGGTRQVGPLPVVDSTIKGELTYPSTKLTGRVAVKKILFLGNGVHLFANVEGL
jgi:hypothetical protein